MGGLTNGALAPEVAGIALADAAQGARRATGAASASAAAADPQVVATARRRQFSGAEKRRILLAADQCSKPGELGALLRREGIYSSMLSSWRKQRIANETAALNAKQRGRKPDVELAEARKMQRLEREIDLLRRRLAQAQEIIDVQKKLCNLLGLPTADLPQETD